jgi:uncharacterized membrane protein HdeD (DUF308 family)
MQMKTIRTILATFAIMCFFAGIGILANGFYLTVNRIQILAGILLIVGGAILTVTLCNQHEKNKKP